MRQIKRMFKLYGIFITQELKRFSEYRGDFLTGVIGFLTNQLFNIVFLTIIFSKIPNLVGWSFEQVVFIYGFSLIPKGIDHLLFDNLWHTAHFTVMKGQFDKYLTRPINTLFHVLVERFQVDAFGELTMGILLMVFAMPKLAIEWSIFKVLLLIVVIPFATLIYTSIKIATTALSFWIKKSGNITFMFYMVNEFVKYPVSIYNKPIQTVLTYFVPFALTSYFPALYVLTGENPLFNIGLTVLVSVAFLVASIFVWNKGISAYESAGS